MRRVSVAECLSIRGPASPAGDAEEPEIESPGNAGDLRKGSGAIYSDDDTAMYTSQRYARAKQTIQHVELNAPANSLSGLDTFIANGSVSL